MATPTPPPSAVSHDEPQFAHPAAHLVRLSDHPKHMMTIPPSRMFLIRDALKVYAGQHGADAPTYDASQGDGGASLPGVPTALLHRAAELQAQHGTSYDQPWGTVRFRRASAEQYWQLDAASGWGPENIAFVQGGRDGLLKAYNAMITLGHGRVGDVLVVSRVPWVSYNWGPYGVGLNVLRAPGDPVDGWRYTSASIRACATYAERHGRKVAGLVITSPDNPTGQTLSADEQVTLARAALEAGYPYVLFDWMYHWVTDSGPTDINAVLGAFTPDERKRLIVLDGITKSLGASNIRAAQVLADKSVIASLSSQASHGVIPSFYAQAVCIAAYEQGFGDAAASIIAPCSQSRQVLRQALAEAGVPHIIGDGYYAFIDCTRFIEAGADTLRTQHAAQGKHYEADSESLLLYAGERYGVVFVPGIYFSEDGRMWVRFSYALPPHTTQAAATRLFEALNSLL